MRIGELAEQLAPGLPDLEFIHTSKALNLYVYPQVVDYMSRDGKLALDAQRMIAKWGGAPVDLTVTEFWMVHSLARHPGHVKDRDQLMRDAQLGLNFTAPNTRTWKKGDYRVDTYVGDEKVNTQQFQVVDASEAGR